MSTERVTKKIGTRLVTELTPYEKNSRTHTPTMIAKLVKSIKKFGFVNPILIDEKNSILAGHARLEAAKSAGLRKVPVLIVEHLTKAEKRAYVIADNRIALDSGWNFDLLNEELKDLKLDDFDLEVTGFDLPELGNLLGSFVSVATGETDPKDAWAGMPEFNHKDKTPLRTIHVHFRTEEDIRAFAELVKQTITDKTRYLWFPNIEIETMADKAYDIES